MVHVTLDEKSRMWKAVVDDEAGTVIYAKKVKHIIAILRRANVPDSQVDIDWLEPEWKRRERCKRA